VDVFYIHYENRRMKPIKIVLRKGGGSKMEWVNLRYIITTYVNITMYPTVQLLYANKNFKTKHQKYKQSNQKEKN
jgi:phosphotransferase system  glucose/maltose/N-acetylglucosamine-specific IIC component